MIFFTIFTCDLTSQTTNTPANAKESKYADDLFLWKTSTNITTLQAQLTTACSNLKEWSQKWRINFSTVKTEAMVFKKGATPTINIKFGNETLKTVQEKRILGITVDNKLKFQPHISKIAAQAKNSANVISQLRQLNVKSCINIYKAFSQSRLMYGSLIIWEHALNSYGNFPTLLSAQHHGLRKIIQATPSTATSTLQAELQIPPVDLQVNDLVRREYAKIMSKTDTDPTKSLIESKAVKNKAKLSPVDFISEKGKELEK